MPRYPEHSPHAASIRGMTFSAFGPRIARLRSEGRLIPLHLGDTHVAPPPEALSAAGLDDPSTHLYGPTPGLVGLRQALASDLGVSVDRVHVSPGATGGLSVAANTMFGPGDEVIVITPSWPLIFGILQRLGVQVVEVPAGPDGCPESVVDRVHAAVTPRTAGLYLCQPNNPVGFVYSAAEMNGLADLATAQDLWLLVDEAYHDLVFDGAPLRELMTEDDVARRAMFVRSFSKSWALAGERIGCLVCPVDSAPLVARVGAHLIYHTSVPSQRMAQGALSAGPAYHAGLREVYRAGADATCAALEGRVRFSAPAAGYYVWLDLREHCADDAAALAWLGALLDKTGVTLAPGIAFGADWGRFARLCFTAVAPEVLADGLSRVADFLERG